MQRRAKISQAQHGRATVGGEKPSGARAPPKGLWSPKRVVVVPLRPCGDRVCGECGCVVGMFSGVLVFVKWGLRKTSSDPSCSRGAALFPACMSRVCWPYFTHLNPSSVTTQCTHTA
jgi:hypothetical protein